MTDDTSSIYISLPIFGNKDAARQAEDARKKLAAMGYNPVTPFDINELCPHDGDTDDIDLLLNDLNYLPGMAGVFFCQGWETSYGCQTENGFAKYLRRYNPKFQIMYEGEDEEKIYG